MPVTTGKDAKDCYAIWGQHGKKYYYECGNTQARARARKKAQEQGQAVRAAGWRGN